MHILTLVVGESNDMHFLTMKAFNTGVFLNTILSDASHITASLDTCLFIPVLMTCEWLVLFKVTGVAQNKTAFSWHDLNQSCVKFAWLWRTWTKLHRVCFYHLTFNRKVKCKPKQCIADSQKKTRTHTDISIICSFCSCWSELFPVDYLNKIYLFETLYNAMCLALFFHLNFTDLDQMPRSQWQ